MRSTMTDDLLDALPARNGHFLLESGYHTDFWITLDVLFVSPRKLAPLVSVLAGRLAAYKISAVCGPLLGGAFLAQALASLLEVDFYFTEQVPTPSTSKLLSAQYSLSTEFRQRIRGQRVAIVDDAISAGSSVRATAAAALAAGGLPVVVGALLALGTVALDYFHAQSIPVETLVRREHTLWMPADCPLCRAGLPLEDPTLKNAALPRR